MTKERFTVDSEGKYWDKINHEYVTIDNLFRTVEKLDKENEELKSFIKKLQDKNGDILLYNGYAYTKKYVEGILK